MKLYVIAGHGQGDPGACAAGYNEAERVRALAATMKSLGGSSVEVLNTAVNWYQTGGISSLNIASGDCLIELHMDSASASAKGGHVIIPSGVGGADAYDKALASFIGSFFPGRSNTIVERGDLANCNRAKGKGINYRLLEVCFISNDTDRAKFNASLDAVATGILGAFGIVPVPVFDQSKTGSRVQLYYPNQTTAQKWRIIPKDGLFIIENVGTGKRLDRNGAQTKNGTEVWAYPKNDTVAQLWQLECKEDEYSTCAIIRASDNPTQVVDVKDGYKTIGNPIQMYEDNGTAAQRFTFIPADNADEYYIIAVGAQLPLDVAGNK